MIAILLITIATIALNLIISYVRKEDWFKWVTLSIIIGPLSLPFQLFCKRAA